LYRFESLKYIQSNVTTALKKEKQKVLTPCSKTVAGILPLDTW
jgi:hypothetical protein